MDNKSNSDFQPEKVEITGATNCSLGSFESGDGAKNKPVDESINMSVSPLNADGSSPELVKKNDKFIASLKAITNTYPVKVHTEKMGFTLFFHKRNPESFSAMKEYDAENANWFYRSLHKEGVVFNPSQNQLSYVSHELTDKQLRLVIIGVQRALSYVYGYVDNM